MMHVFNFQKHFFTLKIIVEFVSRADKVILLRAALLNFLTGESHFYETLSVAFSTSVNIRSLDLSSSPL